MIDLIRLGEGVDKAYWSFEKSGFFTTQSAFLKRSETGPKLNTILISLIWKPPAAKVISIKILLVVAAIS